MFTIKKKVRLYLIFALRQAGESCSVARKLYTHLCVQPNMFLCPLSSSKHFSTLLACESVVSCMLVNVDIELKLLKNQLAANVALTQVWYGMVWYGMVWTIMCF